MKRSSFINIWPEKENRSDTEDHHDGDKTAEEQIPKWLIG
jgi:hypothetical protein